MRFRSTRFVLLGSILALLLSVTAAYASSAGDVHANAPAAASAQGSWVVQSSGTKENLYSVSAPTERSAWAVGSFGTILHTADGQSWNAQTAGDGYHYQGFMQTAFPDESHGWVAYRGLGLLHTADGGATWSLQDDGIPVMRRWDTVTAFDASHAWSGTNSDVRRTSDAGATWLSGTLSLPIESPVKSLTFPTAVEGWAASSFDITHTSDGGATWVQQLHHHAGGGNHWVFKAISFTDALHGWAVGRDPHGDGLVVHTEDGGAHWVRQSSGTPIGYTLTGVCFVDTLQGWAVGTEGTIIHTVDGGATWRPEASGTTEELCSIDMVDSSRGWAVGFNGTIIGYSGAPTPTPTPSIQSISPTKASAGTGTNVTITGSGFGTHDGNATVLFLYKPATTKAAVQYIPANSIADDDWTDTRIICEVPVDANAYLRSAASGPVMVLDSGGHASNAVNLSVSFGFLWWWIEPVVEYSISTTNVGWRKMVKAAAETWSEAGSAFRFTYRVNRTAKQSLGDGVNEIYWKKLTDERGKPMTALAETLSLPNPLPASGEVYETDIVFNTRYKWGSLMNQKYDVQTIALHEMGHVLGLRDLYGAADKGKVMCGNASQIGFFGRRRKLSADDIAGAKWIYQPRTPDFAVGRDNGCDQTEPSISGSWVVWQDEGDGAHIEGRNLSTGQTISTLGTSANDQTDPSVSGTTVFWVESGASSHIRGMSLTAGSSPFWVDPAISGADQDQPAASNNIVVWRDERDGYGRIYGKNLATGAVFPVGSATGHEQSDPAVDGILVAWEDERDSIGNDLTIRVYCKDLATGQEFAIGAPSNTGAWQMHPAVAGRVVAYLDGAEGGFNTVRGKDTSTGRDWFVAELTQAVNLFEPAASGDLVVWTALGSDGRYSSRVYGRSLSGGAGFAIGESTQPIPLQGSPAVSGQTVVWADSRGGYSRIFGHATGE